MSRIHTSFGLLAILAMPAIAAAQAPTFTKDVAKIFQEKCEACHRPDSIAPMSLVTFEEARPWARSIKSRVASRQMPPWHIDKSVGITEFENDRSLSDKEIDRYIRFAESMPGQRYHDVSIRALDEALVQAARRIGSRLGMRMNQI